MCSYLLVLLNLFSPHRFSNDHEFVAELTPIHGRLVQFLQQYIYLSCGRSDPNESLPQDCNLRGDGTRQEDAESPGMWHSRMTLTAKEFSVCGRRVTTFDRLLEEDRERLAALMQYQLIGERLGAATTSRDRQQTRAEWLFAFCIEALNDLRVDEVWYEDYLTRLAASDKFSALVLKDINNFVNKSASR